MNDIVLVATEIIPGKQYVVCTKHRVSPQEFEHIRGVLKQLNATFAIIGPADIIPADQIERFEAK